MTHPATVRTARPLDGIDLRAAGPPALISLAVDHLRSLGCDHPTISPGAGTGVISLDDSVHAEIVWARAAPPGEVSDEATAQAATGVMHVHGRSSGEPRALAADYLTTMCAVLTVQGLLAALLGRARGADTSQVLTGVDLAGLLAVSQYLAAATAEDGEAVPIAPGGPPFTTADGVLFEVETLDPGVWVAFWRALGVPDRVAGSAWRSFQFRYATACAPLPEDLHVAAAASTWPEVRQAARESRASVCALTSLADRRAEPIPEAPWQLSPGPPFTPPHTRTPETSRPLAGLTVLEAGRRIQAPLTAHLLTMLGAEVIRIEPPGGDPLRGMPPTCGGLSARWLALNRGKTAVEIDIKSATGRAELRELVAGADVFVHNWAPGTAERLGLDHDDLAEVNPGLVYAYTSGWAGQLADAPLGTDFMVQARTGVGEAVRPEGEPAAPSLMTLLDVLGGLLGAEAVLAGLLLRERTRTGVRVDSSLLGASETLIRSARHRTEAGLDPRAPKGFRRPIRTTDGWVAVADGTGIPDLPRELNTAEALGLLKRATAVTTALDALPTDPRFSAALTRDGHGATVVPAPWRLA
ncbi:CoA transferase [Nonomuraea endophytica]|uniref:Crotonobetainyl-CoA:carnitine CoA-transferase CaiB-like acyl-CoA transferase n=1 Tax=Nonomuraea endophytica TaxID=714136 RepID=A0A7W8AEP8_9ACTN|nr:CoA transferase [Nonomuraea endophytica]MBB5084817.1 crotonobetainyl-CoA:carnitine CoA-transferase CaiB-like acyl-CoA transferase [Nonomuraea endophytica]